MRFFTTIIAAAFLLSACVSNPVPEGYTGPLAKVQDTFTKRSDRASDFFYVDAINGNQVDNALRATTSANYGRGFAMDPAGYIRNVPAEHATFLIVGRTHYAAPILELTNTVYEVKGSITFTPAANSTYVVRGELGPDRESVWIEELDSKKIMGKIEQK